MQESGSLYAAREPIFPRRVYGKFRNLKWFIMAVTLGIYYLTPWLRWDRGPNLPNQAVLVDLASRRFYFFGIEIWAHEFYFVAGLLIMAGIGLFLFTAILGRVWCGYTCPQTVWTDLFILVERWIEGDRNARVKLWNEKWSLRKLRLRLIKWTVWLLIAVATGGAWVFYFADAPKLFHDLITLNAHPVAYTSIAILTSTTFVFGGFMREQICIYMCPWPRIQAAMIDKDTLTVSYRNWRGEPRGKKRGEGFGDCIDCMACVNVCPMGIDIRNGQQMECITCALCIDACDDVMKKIGRPRGLIDYLTLGDEELERHGKAPKPIIKHILRLRTFLYAAIFSAIGIGLLFAIIIRSDLEITIRPERNPLYVVLADGTVRNIYTIGLRNKLGETREIEFNLQGVEGLTARLEGEDDLFIELAPDVSNKVRVYVEAVPGSAAALSPTTEISFSILNNGELIASKATTFNGKGD